MSLILEMLVHPLTEETPMTQVLDIPAPTSKQIAMINSLLKEKVTVGTIFEGHVVAPEGLSVRSASEAISALMDLQSNEKKPAKAYKEAFPGYYSHGDDLYEVCVSKQKRKYAKKLIVRTDFEGKITRASWEFIAGALATFQEWESVDLDYAKNFGKAWGVCMCCGRLLTNPTSVEAGIGPICSSKFG